MKNVKHFVSFSILVFLSVKTFGQDMKEVLISRVHRQVPEGKVWVLSNQKNLKVLFSEGTMRSGTLCNAALYSNPKHTFGIAYYDSTEQQSRPKNIGFTFQEMEETMGSDIHLIKPHFILQGGIGIDALKNSLSWKFEPMEVVFYPEMVVFTNSCISEIILLERTMTKTDKANYQKILER